MWKLLRIWDYFIIVSDHQYLISNVEDLFFVQHGWKAIFKTSIQIMTDFEEQLLDMSFEMMLSQMPNLQQKFFIVPFEGSGNASAEEKDQWKK